MSQPKIELNVRKVNDQASIIDIHGEVNATAERALMNAYNEASHDRVRAIILNFGGLEYMNSSGIGLLVTLLIRVNRQKQKLLSYGLSEHYQQIFGLSRLNEAIGVYQSESEALAGVS